MIGSSLQMLVNRIIIETGNPRVVVLEAPMTIYEVRDLLRRDGNDPIIYVDTGGTARVSFVPLTCPFAYPTTAFRN